MKFNWHIMLLIYQYLNGRADQPIYQIWSQTVVQMRREQRLNAKDAVTAYK